VGHSEAAAGVMGLLHSAAGVGHRAVQALLHLASLNPYLEASVRPRGGAGAPGWHLPRQQGGLPTQAAEGLALTGVSAFAFQGTNAHALLQGLPLARAAAPAAAAAPPAFRRARAWAAPPASALLAGPAAVAPGGAKAEVHVGSCAHPALAFLWQHVALGQPLLPASCLLELAAAGARLLAPGLLACGGARQQQQVALLEAVFPAVLALREAGRGGGLVLAVHSSGQVEVSSTGARGGRRRHLYGTLAAAPACLAAAAGGPADAAAELVLEVLGRQRPGAAGPLAYVAPAPAEHRPGGLLLHPCVLEACLQAQALLQRPGGGAAEDGAPLRAPARIRAVLLGACDGSGGAWATASQAPGVGDGSSESGFSLRASSGAALCCAEGVELRVVQPGGGGGGGGAAGLALAEELLPGGVGQELGWAGKAAASVMGLESVQALVQGAVEAVLGQVVGAQEPLLAAGLDSLGAVEVRQSLQQAAGMELPATLVFDYPSVAAISAFVHQQLQGEAGALPPGRTAARSACLRWPPRHSSPRLEHHSRCAAR
jgi:hypothetical protein